MIHWFNRMLKKAASVVLASLGRPGRLTISAARTNVVLLIRRTVRPSTYTIKCMERSCAGGGLATGKTRVPVERRLSRQARGGWVRRRVGRAGCDEAFLTILEEIPRQLLKRAA